MLYFSVAYLCVAVKVTCKKDQFQCLNVFQCISKEKYRDGKPDCVDMSDEPNNSKMVLLCVITLRLVHFQPNFAISLQCQWLLS